MKLISNLSYFLILILFSSEFYVAQVKFKLIYQLIVIIVLVHVNNVLTEDFARESIIAVPLLRMLNYNIPEIKTFTNLPL